MPELKSLRHEAFCREYCVDRNGTAAAARAGFSPKTARQQANRLMSNPQIRERIAELSAELLRNTDITAERVMRELANLAFSDVRRLYDDKGNLLPVHKLDPETAAAVSGIEVETHWEGRGEDAVPVTVRKIRRYDKVGPLKILAQHFKIVGAEEADGVNALAAELAARLKAARLRARGKS